MSPPETHFALSLSIFSALAMNTRLVHFATSSSHPHRANLWSPRAASSSDCTPTCQLDSRHSLQLNRIARVSYPSPNNSHISHPAEENELRLEMTRECLVKSNFSCPKSETTVDQKIEYAKILLGFAFPMLVSLVVAASKITKTTGGRIAAIALSFALALWAAALLSPSAALVLLGWAYFRRENKMKVPEEGELVDTRV